MLSMFVYVLCHIYSLTLETSLTLISFQTTLLTTNVTPIVIALPRASTTANLRMVGRRFDGWPLHAERGLIVYHANRHIRPDNGPAGRRSCDGAFRDTRFSGAGCAPAYCRRSRRWRSSPCTGASKHQPDVLVLDIQMPNKNGIEVARAVRAAGGRAGILILTAYDDEPYNPGRAASRREWVRLKNGQPR